MREITTDWLRERLSERRGLKAELARHLGLDPQKISKMASGERRVQAAELPKILAFFGEDPDVPTIPIVGYVGGGAAVYPVDDHAKGAGPDAVQAPPGLSHNAVGVVVRGDSMWPVFRDGDVLIYDQRSFDPSKYVGKECVVGLSDGRTLVKTLRRDSGEGWRLTSHNAEEIAGAGVEWAALVRYVVKS